MMNHRIPFYFFLVGLLLSASILKSNCLIGHKEFLDLKKSYKTPLIVPRLICANNNYLTSQSVPLITITVDDRQPCPGQPVTFTASVIDSGSNPVYQWQVNGVNQGTDSPTFTLDMVSSKLAISDVVRCIVTDRSNGISATSNIISSIQILDYSKINVSMYDQNSQQVAQVSICQGSQVNFLYGIVYNDIGALDPSLGNVWQYQLNGIDLPFGSDLGSFVKNGDVVTIKITFKSKCFNNAVVSTNQTTVYVTPSVAPSVSIAADSFETCAGSQVTYRATALNAGTSPVYEWLLNGQKAGTNDSAFTSSSFKTGDQLQCQVTSSNPCVTGAASSNSVTVNLLSVVQNSVSISSTITGKYITSGQAVTFTAQVADTTNVSYQWQVNGINIGTNSRSFISALLRLGDAVTCQVIKAGKCVIPQTATSNVTTILILMPLVVPNTFTPNGDGINDTWNLRALLAYPGCLIQVYNRYGAGVYQSIGYTSAWDGTSSGKLLPVGTYYYLIDLKNGQQVLSGSITILK